MATPAVRPEYRLTHAPDGTSWTDRENLTDILERELLGPAHGEDELLAAKPDALYLVGRIAPAKLRDACGTTLAEDGDALTDDDLVASEEAPLGRGVPVGVEDGSAGGADDEGVEDSPIRRGMMIPASMGLRFQVSRKTASVVIHASWGTYRSEAAAEDESGNSPNRSPKRVYRRTPHHYSKVVPVGTLAPGTTERVVLEGDVVLQVDVIDFGDVRVVEAALCNNRETPKNIPIDAWLYQTQLHVEASPDASDKAVFLPVNDVLATDVLDAEPELAQLQLQYRDRLEFAVGRTCSVDWALDLEATKRRATQVRTTWLPMVETPQTRAHEIDGVLLDMNALETATPAELEAGLRPISTEYQAWLDQQVASAAKLPEHLRLVADDVVREARRVAKQLDAGLDFLLSDAEALRCFQFMNRVMADQRIHTQIAELRATDATLSFDQAKQTVENRGSAAHSWRTFQLAFILMQIEALSRPAIARRSDQHRTRAELLFFPTGGGKTEAYLGLAAYAFAARRRDGVLHTPDGTLDGNAGVAVLMRYTLRLLTAQQFQRATAMVCAAEIARRKDPKTWGAEPFRIGLWVGTAVSPKRFEEAKQQLEDANAWSRYGLTVLQLQRCPWCGTAIEPRNVKSDVNTRRIRVFCGDQFDTCPFSEGGAAGDEGLPVLTVDEEIYRLVPSFVIATVDKFARLAREGEAASLFGFVRKYCERHGYIHEDQTGPNKPCTIKVGGRHPASNRGAPAASVRACDRLRPPDLIIQDELHLITGALGTTVGFFELAIDVSTTWRNADGLPVRPLVVASTATVRNAAQQIKRLYGRKVTVFPPQVLDVADTFFSVEVPVSREFPGRRYLGVSTTGVRLTTAEIEVAATLLSAGQLLLDRDITAYPPAADPYLTLVGYFNATRELAGMARYMSDDVQTKVAKPQLGKNFPFRYGTAGALNRAELTSRVSSSDITATLGEMAVPFDASWDTTVARQQRREQAKAARAAGKKPEQRKARPFDVVLATSMLQVGVDVTRLGLMLMVGQPKNTAEYIQATSRVGRDPNRPGLVVTLGNWARPRDLAHFEQFRHYHETFYSQVEPLSVTPYSLTSMQRSIDGVLVAAIRVAEAARDEGLSPERSAWRIEEARDRLDGLREAIVERAKVAGGEAAATDIREHLTASLGNWTKRRDRVKSKNQQLVYEKIPEGNNDLAALMRSLENGRIDTATLDDPPFEVANSMREVQPEINLLVTPLPTKLMSPEVLSDPPNWEAPPAEGDQDNE